MQDKFRIAIITRSLMMGGAQNHIVKLCKELENQDISIYVFLLINDEPRDLLNEIPARFKVYISPYRRHDLRTIFWLANSIKREKIQLAHSFLWHADFYASLLKIFVPQLIVLGSERGDRGAKGFYRFPYRWVDRLFVFNIVDGICANSQFGARLINAAGCKQEKIRIIYNGIDLATVDSCQSFPLKQKYDWPESAVVCVVVSRLINYKGIDLFIKILRFSTTDIRVVIIGDGPEKENLLQLIRELKLEDRVVLAGQIAPVIPWINGADICALPTRDSEHCSNSILEYMACAKPVIATDVGGNPELVLPGETGFLINQDQMAKMAESLDTLAMNKELAAQMGLSGRKRIETVFRMESSAEKFLALWNEFYFLSH